MALNVSACPKLEYLKSKRPGYDDCDRSILAAKNWEED